MQLTDEDVVRLARQARFSLSPEERERFRVQLNSVLQQIRVLAELDDAPRISDEAHVQGTLMRSDESEPDGLQRPLESFGADMVSGFFTVPRVIGEGGAPQ